MHLHHKIQGVGLQQKKLLREIQCYPTRLHVLVTVSTLLVTSKYLNTVSEEGIALITDSTGTLDIMAVIVFSRAGCTPVGGIAVVVNPDTHKIISTNYGSLKCKNKTMLVF